MRFLWKNYLRKQITKNQGIVEHFYERSSELKGATINKIAQRLKNENEVAYAFFIFGQLVLIHNNPLIKATEGMKKGGTIIVVANPDGLSTKEEKVVDDIIKKSMEGSENE